MIDVSHYVIDPSDLCQLLLRLLLVKEKEVVSNQFSYFLMAVRLETK